MTSHSMKNIKSNKPHPSSLFSFLIGSQAISMAPMAYTLGRVFCLEWRQLSPGLGLKMCPSH